MKDLKLRLKKNKNNGGANFPKFSISFNQSTSKDESKLNSYDILSKLKGDNDLVLEVNSSLFNMHSSERESYATDILYSIRDFDLEYRYRKVASQSSGSIISQLFGLKKDSFAHEILAYIPDKIWRLDNFYTILPSYGARYYITKGHADGSKTLDSLSLMLDEEKIDFFKFSVFDSCCLGYMGITGNITLDEIEVLLGL
jgi:hypothetical protein